MTPALARLAELAPSREEARDAARDELSRPDYEQARGPLVLRLVGRAVRELGELLGRAAAEVPGGRLGVVLLLLLLGLLVGVVVTRLRPSLRSGRVPALFGPQAELSAEEHRRLAEGEAAAGRWAEAVRERLRAVVRELEARGVLDPRPGRTAGEVARDAGAAVPAVAADLRRAATAFEEVWYGGKPADASSYAVVVAVDDAVRGARLVVA